jgi:CRP-like cAMP-binding protein
LDEHFSNDMTLLTFLHTQFGVYFQDQSQFPIVLKNQTFKKRSVITDYGQIERKLYFINSGVVELTMLHDGEEKIIDFFFQDCFVCAYTSFLKQEASDIRITALSECHTEVMQYADVQEAYKTSLLFNKIGRILTEQIYIIKTKREKDFLTKSGQERYMELIAKRPDMLKTIPINKIAKYLGLRPESLSRIRKSLIC